MPILKCKCPIYCVYCGRRRSRGAFGIGHYCKTENCQNQKGYSGCDYCVEYSPEIHKGPDLKNLLGDPISARDVAILGGDPSL